MSSETAQKLTYLICFAVISIAVSGFFIGLQSPMNPAMKLTAEEGSPESIHNDPLGGSNSNRGHVVNPNTIFATGYADMPAATTARSAGWRTSLIDLRSNIDPLAEVTVTPEQKAFALAIREHNRAFNGAPPTIPHPVDQMSAESCMACHGEGAKTESLRISKMSHQFLANCTQCHVENNPKHMTASLFRENDFVGLPAPTGGSRAYVGAPPTIPHSTWMRVECMSCHGFAGQQGMRTTHPWRQNCQQCHVPSSTLDQTQLDAKPAFLAPPIISQ